MVEAKKAVAKKREDVKLRRLRVGQIWRSKDYREKRNLRQVKILELHSPWVFALSQTSDSDTGRKVRISQSRFLSTIKHYFLLKDAPEDVVKGKEGETLDTPPIS